MAGLNAHSTNLDPAEMPDGFTVFGFFLLLAATFAHILALTPLTNNLDDIKYVTMGAGGGLCLVALAVLWIVRRHRTPSWIVAGPYLLYIVVLLVSTLNAASYAQWIGWQITLTHLSLAGFFFLGLTTVCTVRMIRLSVRFWVVVALVTCMFGLFHYVGGMEAIAERLEASYLRRNSGFERGPFHMLIATFASQRQMLSTILNTQFFGVFLALLVPITASGTIANFEDARDRLSAAEPAGSPIAWAMASACATILCLLCMYFTYSKTVLVLIGVVAVIYIAGLLAISRYNVFKLPAWPVAWVLLLSTVVIIIALSYGDLVTKMSEFRNSFFSRMIMWRGAWEIFLDHPILGAGPGSYRVEFPTYRSPDYHLFAISNLTLSAHNRLLDLLAEDGIVGFISYMGFLIGIFWLGLKAILRCKIDLLRAIMMGYLVGILGLYLGSMTTPMMRWPIGAVTVHVALGMAAGVAMTILRGNEGVERRYFNKVDLRVKLAVAGLAAGIIICGMNSWLAFRFFTGSSHNNRGVMLTTIAEQYARSTDPRALQIEKATLIASIAEFDKALESNPTFLTSYYKKAYSLNRLGSLAKAPVAAQMEKFYAGRMLTDSESKALREAILEGIENHKRALDTYEALRHFAPDYSEVHLNEAIIGMTVAKDMMEMTRLAGIDASEGTALRAEASARFRDAVDSIDRATRQSNKISVHYLAGQIHTLYASYLQNGSAEFHEQLIAAGEAYSRTATLPFSVFIQDPGQLERERDERRQAAFLAARAYRDAEAWEQTAKAYLFLAGESLGRSDYFELAAYSYEKAGFLEEKERVIEEGLNRNPLSPALLILRAESIVKEKGDSDPRAAKEAVYYVREIRERLPNLLDAANERRLESLLQTAKELQDSSQTNQNPD